MESASENKENPDGIARPRPLPSFQSLNKQLYYHRQQRETIRMSDSIEKLLKKINDNFHHKDWSWVNTASDSQLEAFFASAHFTEKSVKAFTDNGCIHSVTNKHQLLCIKGEGMCSICKLSDYEHVSDLVLMALLSNSDISTNTLSKAFAHYAHFCSEVRLDKLTNKIIAQAAMLDAAVMYSGAPNSFSLELLYKKFSQGSSSYPEVSQIIVNMMTKNSTSLMLLLESLLSFNDNNNRNEFTLFVSQIIFVKLGDNGADSYTIWKTLFNTNDKDLLTKLTAKYPEFLEVLSKFFVSCIKKIDPRPKVTATHGDSTSLITCKEYIKMFNCLFSYGGTIEKHFQNLYTDLCLDFPWLLCINT